MQPVTAGTATLKETTSEAIRDWVTHVESSHYILGSMAGPHPFVENRRVRLIGVEAAGQGVATGHHAATLTAGRPGVLHGTMSLLLQDEQGQVLAAHSISAGLETAYALTWLETLCPTLPSGTEVVINCSGRGDKDMNSLAERLGQKMG